jgi:hypothetical protein
MASLLEIYCDVDDFWQWFYPQWEKQQKRLGVKRMRTTRLSMSEVMTLMIWFHMKRYRDLKTYYQEYVCVYLKAEFPGLVSYGRFVELITRASVPLLAYMKTRCVPGTGLAYIDATSVRVCHNRRIPRHRVFDGIAQRGKTSMGWFYGFKLHLVVTEQGDIVNFAITPGNVDDRQPVTKLVHELTGWLFGDKGYISQSLAAQLLTQGLKFVTTVRQNMTQQLLTLTEKLLLRRRVIVETVNDQLKNISQIEHSRHRNPFNFLANLLAGLIAYTFQPKKPSLNLDINPLAPMVA